MGTLGSMVSQFKFKPWEVDDRRYTLSMDLAQVEATPFTVVLEGLHQVAYRSKGRGEGELIPQSIVLNLHDL